MGRGEVMGGGWGGEIHFPHEQTEIATYTIAPPPPTTTTTTKQTTTTTKQQQKTENLNLPEERFMLQIIQRAYNL